MAIKKYYDSDCNLGEVLVNGETCTMRGRKIRPGDTVSLDGVTLKVV